VLAAVRSDRRRILSFNSSLRALALSKNQHHHGNAHKHAKQVVESYAQEKHRVQRPLETVHPV